jgi:hypothetical protein
MIPSRGYGLPMAASRTGTPRMTVEIHDKPSQSTTKAPMMLLFQSFLPLLSVHLHLLQWIFALIGTIAHLPAEVCRSSINTVSTAAAMLSINQTQQPCNACLWAHLVADCPYTFMIDVAHEPPSHARVHVHSVLETAVWGVPALEQRCGNGNQKRDETQDQKGTNKAPDFVFI